MDKKTKIIIGFLAGFLFLSVLTLLLSSIYQAPKAPSDKIQVSASFYPLYFFSQEIGRDKVEVANITPAGIEPHEYEPTARDIAKIEKSQLLVLNGGGLESWGDDIKQNIGPKTAIIVMAEQELVDQQMVEGGEVTVDPHIWLSPLLAKKMVDKITRGFVQVDPANSAFYQANAMILKNKLDNLDADFKTGLVQCLQKNIITSHAAFGYLAVAYGFSQVSISGLSPEAEPSLQELIEMVEFAKANKIKYIFFENLVSPKLSQTLADEVGAKTLVLNPLEGLTDEQISQGENYFTKMQKNLSNLSLALECRN